MIKPVPIYSKNILLHQKYFMKINFTCWLKVIQRMKICRKGLRGCWRKLQIIRVHSTVVGNVPQWYAVERIVTQR
jgi:hypothetical protein